MRWRCGEQQLPQFHGGSEAVMPVFCFGFLLLFRVSGATEPEEESTTLSVVFKFNFKRTEPSFLI